MKSLNQIDLLALPVLNNPASGFVSFGAKSDGLYQKVGTVQTKLATINDTVANSQKLNNQWASYYLNWDNLTNKPATFTPAAHIHSISNVSNLESELANRYTTTETLFEIQKAKSTNYGYRYYYTLYMYGNHDKYYPFTIMGGVDQNVKRDILIKRAYSELHPAEWYTDTHGGGLTLKIKTNFGAWGGAEYNWEIHELAEMYNPTFGGAVNHFSGMGFCIFLRGGGTGGAVYHIYSDQPIEVMHSLVPNASSDIQVQYPRVFYNSDLIKDSGNPQYTWNAPAPLSEPNSGLIRKKNFIKLTQLLNDSLYDFTLQTNTRFVSYFPISTYRDFADGTLVKTDIDYSQSFGDPFYIEIKGNTYQRNNSVFTQVQGYIYYNTIINYGVTHLGFHKISGIKAMNIDGNLCFWFPRQSYWEGYSIKVTTGYDYKVNRVLYCINSVEPASATKKVNLYDNEKQSFFAKNIHEDWLGRIGIGTENPSANLHLVAPSGFATLKIDSPYTASDSRAELFIKSGWGNSTLRFVADYNHVSIQVGNYAFNANSELWLSGYYGNKGSAVNFDFANSVFLGNVTSSIFKLSNNWTIEASGQELHIKQGGILKAKFTADAFISQGDVIATV